MNDEITYRSFDHLTDVHEVNKLFEEAYGERYPYKVESEIPDRGSYSFVAVLKSGGIIGFARSCWLEEKKGPRPKRHYFLGNKYPHVHELGGYVVAEPYRRRGIGEKLSLLCEKAATRTDWGQIHILHSEPVTWGNGLASQKIFHKHGFRVLGLCPMKYPDISPGWHGEQPASMTIVAKLRVDREDKKFFVQYPRYLPDEYEELVQQIMRDCPQAPRTAKSQAEILSRFRIPYVIEHYPFEENGVRGAEIVDVPVNWPEALATIQELKKEGYLFSAFLPEHGGLNDKRLTEYLRFDYLRLYRPPLTYRGDPGLCNWDLIGVIPEAESVKRFCVEEYTRRYGMT